MNSIDTNDELKLAIRQVLEYSWADEAENCRDNPQKNHVALSLEVLVRYVGMDTEGWLT